MSVAIVSVMQTLTSLRRNLDRLTAALALYELTDCPVAKIRLALIIARLS